MGFSAEWRPDQTLMTRRLLYPSLDPSLELAIIECKFISDSSSEGTYWTEMSRAYMSLNDLRIANPHLSFYLAVNRNSKNRTRDYSKIFQNIGVKFVNINNPEERSSFKKSLELILEQSNSDKQAKRAKNFFKKYG